MKPELSRHVRAHIFWNDDEAMLQERNRTAQKIRKLRLEIRSLNSALKLWTGTAEDRHTALRITQAELAKVESLAEKISTRCAALTQENKLLHQHLSPKS